MAPTSAISDARRFADLIGIGEEEPLAFLDPKMDVDRLVRPLLLLSLCVFRSQ